MQEEKFFSGYRRYLILKVLKSTGIFLLVLACILLVAFGFKYVLPFVIGYVVYLILRRPHRLLVEKLRFPNKLSAAVCLLVFLLALAGIVMGLGAFAGSKVAGVIANKDNIIASVTANISSLGEKLTAVLAHLPDGAKNAIADMSSSLSKIAEKIISAAVSIASGTVSRVPAAFIFTVMMILSAFHMLSEEDTIRGFASRSVPDSFKRVWQRFRTTVLSAVGGYIMAQIKIMGVCICELLLGFSIMKLLGLYTGSWAGLFLMCLGIAFLDALPVFGCGTVLLPWIVVALLTGRYWFALALLILYLTTLTVRQFIEPKLVSAHIGLHPLATLLAVYVGYKTLGVPGMIFIPICTILVINMVKLYSGYDTPARYFEHFTREYYEANVAGAPAEQ